MCHGKFGSVDKDTLRKLYFSVVFFCSSGVAEVVMEPKTLLTTGNSSYHQVCQGVGWGAGQGLVRLCQICCKANG